MISLPFIGARQAQNLQAEKRQLRNLSDSLQTKAGFRKIDKAKDRNYSSFWTIQTQKTINRRSAYNNYPSSNNYKKTMLSRDNKSLNLKRFTSFKEISPQSNVQILKTLANMRAKSKILDRKAKQQSLIKKKTIDQMSQFYNQRSGTLDHKQKLGFFGGKSKKSESYSSHPMKKVKKLILPNQQSQSHHKQQQQCRPKRVRIKLGKNYDIYESNRMCYKPYIDYDATTFTIGSKGYFVSGRKQCPAISYDRKQNKWEELKQISNLKPFGQSCPTLIDGSDEVIFFGGIRFYQPGISIIVNSIQILNVKEGTNQVFQFNDAQVKERAYHAQCMYGQFLIISGGIDKNYNILSSFVAYNVRKKYWSSLVIQKQPKKLKQKGLAKHKMIPVFHKRSKYQIYEEAQVIQKSPIKHQGVYIFGGQDGDVEVSNKLYLLQLGHPSLQIVQLKPKGIAPKARKNFAMIRFKNYIVIQGGRNDEMSPFALDSIHFLDLKELQWTKVTEGQRTTPRYGHSLMSFSFKRKETATESSTEQAQEELVIFGGKDEQGLCKEVLPITFQEQEFYAQ